MEKELIHGLMAAYITAIGKIIKCTVKAYSHGLMAENMKASTTMTKSKVMVFFIGPMVDSIMVSGWQESSKVLEFTSMQKEKCGTDAGKMVNALNGSLKKIIIQRCSASRTKERDRREYTISTILSF